MKRKQLIAILQEIEPEEDDSEIEVLNDEFKTGSHFDLVEVVQTVTGFKIIIIGGCNDNQ